MKKLLPLLLLILIGCSPDPNKPINIDELGFNSVQNTYYYENIIGQTTIYSGSIFTVDSLGKIIFDGNLYNGKKEGLFKTYDPNNDYRLLSEQNFKEGKLQGLFTSYNDNGSILLQENYRNNKQDGKSSYYNSDGKLIEEVNFKDGVRDGTTITYHEPHYIIDSENTRVFNVFNQKNPQSRYSYREDNYEDGKLNGESIFYNTNNKKSSETYYRNGKEVGPYKVFFYDSERLSFQSNVNEDGKCEGNYVSYYPNGQKRNEGEMTEGDCIRDWDNLGGNYNKRKTGFWTFWYENGNKHSEGSYSSHMLEFSQKVIGMEISEEEKIMFKGGLQEGLWTGWEENGTIRSERNYRYGLPSGEWKEYNDGKLSSILNYRVFKINGELKSYNYGKQIEYLDGKKFWEFTVGSSQSVWGDDTWIQYKVDSCPKDNITCQTGVDYQYRDNGNVSSSHNYRNGKKHGDYREYWENGNLLTRGQYKNDKLHGETKYFSKDDQINWRTLQYRNGSKIYDSCKSCKDY